MAFILQAATNFLIFNTLERGADAAIFWMLGSFSNARWHLVPLPLTVTTAGIAWLAFRSPRINAMVLGDEAARAVGVDPVRLRLELFVSADVVARMAWAPREVPLGVVTALAGGVVF